MEMRNEPNVRQEQRLMRIIIASTIATVLLCGAFFFIGNLLPSSKSKAANGPQVYYPSGNINSTAVKAIFNGAVSGDTLVISSRLTANAISNLLINKDVIILIDSSDIYWSSKVAFYLGPNSKILLVNNGKLTSRGGYCTTGSAIFIGSTKKVSCDGTGADLSFSDVNTAGGVQSSGVTALPVELMRFEAHRNGKIIELDWATASEQNNSHFEIERSTDGSTWKKIGSIPGNGNSQKVITYHFEDNSSELGKILYYRLKQNDFDGVFEYSFVRMVSDKLEAGTTLTSVYPNPVDKFLNVKIDDLGTYQIQLLDQTGQIKYQMETSQNLETINTSSYQMGIYYVTIQNDRMKESHKIVIKH